MLKFLFIVATFVGAVLAVELRRDDKVTICDLFTVCANCMHNSLCLL